MSNRLRMALLSVLIFFVSGCAGGTMVVLAPNPDGKTGAITVSNQAGNVVIESPNQATTVRNSTQSPTPPAGMSQETINTLFSDALSIQPKPPVHYILYFEKDLLLTSDSAGLLTEILTAIKERNSTDISVVGHTDTLGSGEYNMTLSKNRANTVRDLLVQKGVDINYIKTTSHGKENPLIKTEDNVFEPRNRRVEVVVR
jgi:outer membrane protein OmpA-like peptidoglycan-associated protein